MSSVSPAGRRRLPARLQPLGDEPDARIKLTQVALGEGRDRQLALRPPDFAFGVEHALDADFRQNEVGLGAAAERLGPCAQSLVDQRRVARRDHARPAHPELVGRAVLSRPSLQNEMDSGRLDLVQIADHWQPFRAWQVVQRPRRRFRSSGSLEPGDVDEDAIFALERRDRTPDIPARLRAVPESTEKRQRWLRQTSASPSSSPSPSKAP